MAGSSSGTRPRSTGSHPAWATSASSVGRLVSRICPGRSGSGPVDQLVAGRQHADPRPRVGQRPRRRRATPARRGGRASPRRRRRTPRSPGCRSSPAARTWVPGSTATSTRTARPPSSALGPLDHHDRVGAVGQRRAGHDAHRLARPQRAVGRVARPPPRPTTGRVDRRRRPCRRRGPRSRPSRCWRTAAPPRSPTTSPASTSPTAASAGTGRGASGAQRSRTWASASSSGITRLTGAQTMPRRRTTSARNVGELGAEVVAVEGELDGGPQVVELACRCRSGPRRTRSRSTGCSVSRMAMASVSWISPPTPGLVRSRRRRSRA